MSGGAFSAGSPLYSFFIPDQGGYDLNSNLLAATDSVMGQGNYCYDNLNRLILATAPVSQPWGLQLAHWRATQVRAKLLTGEPSILNLAFDLEPVMKFAPR